MRKLQVLLGLIAAAITFLPASALAQIQLNTVVSGLSSPVFVGNAGDGSNRLFILEQPGIIKVLQPGSSTPTVFLNIQSKVQSGGERGLLGLAFHPLYGTQGNNRFFVFYTRVGDGALVIGEYQASSLGSNTANGTEKTILTIPHSEAANHNGGMLAFGADGYLYIGVGDGGGSNDQFQHAQDVNSLLGKILRINIDAGSANYSIPPGNPFAGVAGADEIYTYGMRNPWRFSFDRQPGGSLWVGDVGQGQREEVDSPIVAGGNYGWPIFEGNRCNSTMTACSNPSAYVFPLFEYDHSVGCSLTGGYVYRGAAGALPQGTYVFGDYCSGGIFGWNGSTRSTLLNTGMSISSFGEDEQGELYVVDLDALNGSVSRIVGSGPPPPPPCTFSITPTRATWAGAGGTGSVTVTTGSTCTWGATPNAQWLGVTNGTGRSGSGTLTYTVAPYSAKPKKRNGTITIAGQTFTVQQSR